MFKQVTALAATTALCASTAFAGGLSPEIVEAPAMEQELVVANPAINPAYIVVGVVALLLIASTLGNVGSDSAGGPPDSTGGPDDECITFATSFIEEDCP